MMKDVIKDYQKLILKSIYTKSIINSSITIESLANVLAQKYEDFERSCKELVELKMVSIEGDRLFLTEKGRKQIVVVLTGGVFDIIHPGHLHTLSSSKKLGDVLLVSVARDETVKRSKGRYPINSEESRVKLIGSLRNVDLSILGSEKNIFDLVAKVRPDVICLGYDQEHDIDDLKHELMIRKINAKIVRLDSPIPDMKSSKIMENKESLQEI